jgi:sec-independent protein translocase protein TatB
MFSIPHIIVIFVVALIIFGPEKLPELARNLGKVMGEFRRATGDLQSTFEGHLRDIERDAEARRIGGAKVAVTPAGALTSDGSDNPTTLPPVTPGEPSMSPAEGTVPSNAPNAAAIAAAKGFAIFAGEEEAAHRGITGHGSAEPEPHSEPSTPAGSPEPERTTGHDSSDPGHTPDHTYDHVSDAGSRQS